MKDTAKAVIQSEIEKELCRVAATIREGTLPCPEQVDNIERLSKLSALFPKQDDHWRQKAEIFLLFLAGTTLLLSVYFRVPTTAAEFDVRISNVKVGLIDKRSNLLIPGENGEIVALKQSAIAGATQVEPPWIANEDGILELPEGKQVPGSTKNPDLALRLQALRIPAGGSFDLGVGVAFRAGSRGLLLLATGSQPTKVSFGEVLAVPSSVKGAQDTQFAIRSVTVGGKELRVELFPLDAQASFTALRNIPIANVSFEREGESVILGGNLFIKSLSQSSIAVQSGDRLQVKSDEPMLVRELVFTKGHLEATISVQKATSILLGDTHPKNLMPSYFDWVRSRWPTQLYATLSALVALWLALKQWWRPTA